MRKLGQVFAKWLKVYSGTSHPQRTKDDRQRKTDKNIDDVLLPGMKKWVTTDFKPM